MAEWKKLVVSGSNISQLNNDAGYLTTATEANGFATASYNGTNILANSSNGVLNFASSSGQGLNISGDAGTDTLTFGLSAIPNTSLANSTISGVSLGGTLAALTAGNGLTSAGTYTGAATRTFSVDSSSLSPYFATASWAGISGDVLISNAGVATIQPYSVALGTDTTGNYVAALGTGTGVTIGSNTGEGSSPTIAVNYGSTVNTAVQGNTTISLTGTANEIEITGTTAQALGGAPSYTIGLPDNVIIAGDLTVNGTTTTVNTENLLIEDKFALLASGSTSAVDGGIIIQNNIDGSGYALGIDASATRWALQSNLAHTATSITPNAYMGIIQEGVVAPSSNPIYGGATGYGTIFVDSNASDIYIWA